MANFKDVLMKVDVKKAVSVVSAVAMGFVAFNNAIADQKKEAEFNEMKKTLAELTKGKES